MTTAEFHKNYATRLVTIHVKGLGDITATMSALNSIATALVSDALTMRHDGGSSSADYRMEQSGEISDALKSYGYYDALYSACDGGDE